VFGAKWADSVPLVMVLCASAATWPLWRATVQLWRARGRPGLELRWTAIYTALSLGVTTAGTALGLMAIGFLLLAVNLAVVPLAAWSALPRQAPSPAPKAAP